MRFGIVGLGKMGMALAKHAARDGLEVVAYNRTTSRVDEAVKEGVIGAYSLEELVEKLESPRIVWLMVAAGKPIETALFGSQAEGQNNSENSATQQLSKSEDQRASVSDNQTIRNTDQADTPKHRNTETRSHSEFAEKSSSGLLDLLEEEDIVVDAVNSHYKDSIRRGRVLLKRGIQFLDVGTSGGVEGAASGACFMIGGAEDAFKKCEPIFQALATEDGYAYFGKSGSGHFVKMVHNGIEYAIMQALGEGMQILEKSEFDIDLASAAKVWGHGSIIEGRLVGWLHKALTEDPGLKNSPAEIGSLGTGKWTVEAALELGVPATAIAHAVFTRYGSRDPKSLAYKVVQALRKQFGGHTS